MITSLDESDQEGDDGSQIDDFQHVDCCVTVAVACFGCFELCHDGVVQLDFFSGHFDFLLYNARIIFNGTVSDGIDLLGASS